MDATRKALTPVPDARIRGAVPEDAEDIARVVNAAFVVERVALEGDRTDSNHVRVMMDTGKFLVAESGSGLAGCVYIEPSGERSYLGLLSVDPQHQGGGLGRRLLTAAEDWARSAGSRAMDLRIISPRAELLPFYRRLGYVETSTSPFPPDVQTKVPSHFIHLSKPLV
jgi:GNAT superfamily N-acetyltransferase